MTFVSVAESTVLPRTGQAEIAAFTYHDVTDKPSTSGFQRPAAIRYKLTVAAFARHLDVIEAVGSPQLVVDVNLATAGRHLLLTFDDGGQSAVTAGDALARRGWLGHFFVVTRLIGSHHFLGAGELRYLRSCGHLIGSHSHTHPDIFREQPRSWMDEEWRVSADVLAQLLGEPCRAASVPGGDISPVVLESAADAGFRYVFTSEPCITPRLLRTCWILGRYCPTIATSVEQIAALSHFRGWRGALFVRRLKELVRANLPTLYRHYVRTRTRDFVSVD
jgi:peptidoglycan/xylan/chitin deacetylase (PgdA/CDA1 family)